MFSSGTKWLAALAAALTFVGMVATATAAGLTNPSVTVTDATDTGNLETDGIVADNTTDASEVRLFDRNSAVNNTTDDVATTAQLHTLTELPYIQGPASGPTMMADVPTPTLPDGGYLALNANTDNRAADIPHCVTQEERRGIGVSELFQWQADPRTGEPTTDASEVRLNDEVGAGGFIMDSIVR